MSGGTLNIGALTLNPGNPVLGVAPKIPIQTVTIPPATPPDSSSAILAVATPNQL